MISSITVSYVSGISRLISKKSRHAASSTTTILSAPTILDCSSQHNDDETCYLLVCVHDPPSVQMWKTSSNSSGTFQLRMWSTLATSDDGTLMTTAPIRANPIVISKNAVVLSLQDGSLVLFDPFRSSVAFAEDPSSTQFPFRPSVIWKNADAAKTWGFSPVLLRYNSNNQEKTTTINLIFASYRDNDITIYSERDGSVLGTIPESDGVWNSPLIDLETKRIYFSKTASAQVVCVGLSNFFKSLTNMASIKESRFTSFVRIWAYDILPNANSYKQKIPLWIWTSPVLSCSSRKYNTKNDVGGDLLSNCFIMFGNTDGILRVLTAKDGKLTGRLPIPEKQSKAGISFSPIVMGRDKTDSDVIVINDKGIIRTISSLSYTSERNEMIISSAASPIRLFSDDVFVGISAAPTFDSNDSVVFTQKLIIDDDDETMFLVVSQKGWIFVLSSSSSSTTTIVKGKLCAFAPSIYQNEMCGSTNKNELVTSASFHEQSGIVLVATKNVAERLAMVKIVRLESLLPGFSRNSKNKKKNINDEALPSSTVASKIVEDNRGDSTSLNVMRNNGSSGDIGFSLDDPASILELMIFLCIVLICVWSCKSRWSRVAKQ